MPTKTSPGPGPLTPSVWNHEHSDFVPWRNENGQFYLASTGLPNPRQRACSTLHFCFKYNKSLTDALENKFCPRHEAIMRACRVGIW